MKIFLFYLVLIPIFYGVYKLWMIEKKYDVRSGVRKDDALKRAGKEFGELK